MEAAKESYNSIPHTGTLGSDREKGAVAKRQCVEHIEDTVIADEGENVISYFSTLDGRNCMKISGCFWMDEQKISDRVYISGKDEIGAIGKDFDLMAEKFQENVLQLR